MNHITTFLAGLALCSITAQAQNNPEAAATSVPAPKQAPKANIQLAILLDTSNSMDGLINQARAQIWKIVNELTLARQNGQLPNIQIALYEYGNSRLPVESGWIRQVLPFTDDLDAVSEQLFALQTSGGTELCGDVIAQATRELAWNKDDPEALKLVFIAGNENFDQEKGSSYETNQLNSISGKNHSSKVEAKEPTYKGALKTALENGITINTIYCGSMNDGDAILWKTAARQADGTYASIDQNSTPPDPETPMDKKLASLSEALNKTYLAYGSRTMQEMRLNNQTMQDSNAAGIGYGAAASRASAKASKVAYRNTSWDLVDRFENPDTFTLDSIGGADNLPDELKGKTEQEIKDYISEKSKERNNLQKQVQELSGKRAQWISDYRKKQSDAGTREKTLDDAILETVRNQAKNKNFRFEKQATSSQPETPSAP